MLNEMFRGMNDDERALIGLVLIAAGAVWLFRMILGGG